MRRWRPTQVGLIAAALVLSSLLVHACAPAKPEPVKTGSIPSGTFDPAAWGRLYPLEYESWLATKEPRPANVSKYKRSWSGGSDFFDRLSEYPYLALLYNGWGMGVEFNEPRGHWWMRIDQQDVDQSRTKAGGVCLNCKTPYADKLVRENGPSLLSMPFADAVKKIPAKHRTLGVACIDCHDSRDMSLSVKNRATVVAGLKALGNPRPQHQQMRTVVCGQCHCSYVISKDKEMKSIGIQLPWQGSRWGAVPVEKIIARIQSSPAHLEFKQAVTGFKLGFIRHPEFELYTTGSVHFKANVACADCHMAYRRVGANKISDHNLMSPLATEMEACRQCHPEQPGELKSQVLSIQDRTMALMTRAGYATATTAKLFEMANRAKAEGKQVDADLYREAETLYEQAFYRTTFLAAENSIGFHNPTEAARIAGDAVAFASKGESLLRQALAKAGVSVPEIVDLELAEYTQDRGAKRLDFRPSQEFKDPTSIQTVLLPREKMGLP